MCVCYLAVSADLILNAESLTVNYNHNYLNTHLPFAV